MEKKRFKLTFDRLSRNRNVGEQEFVATDADELANVVYNFARKHCVSRDIEVVVDLEEMKGNVYAGFHTAGSFTIEEVTA